MLPFESASCFFIPKCIVFEFYQIKKGERRNAPLGNYSNRLNNYLLIYLVPEKEGLFILNNDKKQCQKLSA
jgi:hypothetical protein